VIESERFELVAVQLVRIKQLENSRYGLKYRGPQIVVATEINCKSLLNIGQYLALARLKAKANRPQVLAFNHREAHISNYKLAIYFNYHEWQPHFADIILIHY
jgi:hypothetical protein